MKAAIWGCRGTVPAPGPETVRYGGNTTCVSVETADGRLVVLDCGSGMRLLGASLLPEPPAVMDIILTHMHLDHVTGLGFFGPLFMNKTLRIWGPRLGDVPLAERLATYLGPPLFPLPFSDIPVTLEVTEVERDTWEIGGLKVTSAPIQHPGGALGYRLEEGGSSIAFIPDNELGLDADSGVELATGADILFHDAQYTDAEYPSKVGWGHSSLSQFAAFVRETEPSRAFMFHHDPAHDDEMLEDMRDEAAQLAEREVELSAEGLVLDLKAREGNPR